MMTCYDDAMRTIIELPASQLDALDAWCRRDRISRAEAIRRAVAATVGQQAAGGRKAAFGLWRDRPIDGLAWQERMRREWDDHERPGPPARSARRRHRR
jgi:Arc/MetJ-type ribon-helix-helix transcriptional regulator